MEILPFLLFSNLFLFQNICLIEDIRLKVYKGLFFFFCDFVNKG